MPLISSRRSKPLETPVTRLPTNERDRPHMARPRLSSWRGATVTPSAPDSTVTSSTSVSDSSPFGPFTRTVCPSTVAVTPLGSATGFFPIRDMLPTVPSRPPGSEDPAEHLAAHVLLARLGVGHHALGRRDDRHAEAVVDARQVPHRGIDPTARLRDALDLADHGLALVIFKLDVELGLAVAVLDHAVAADIALGLQHVEDALAQLRGRRRHPGLAPHLRVADAGQHIAERIAHRHRSTPYQLDLTMPGISPAEASSRSAMRDSLSLR